MCRVADLRVEDNDSLENSFNIAKCRTAPMKQQTIPKLELRVGFYFVRLRQLITRDYDAQIQAVALDRHYDNSPMAAHGTQKEKIVRGQ